jgi:hypothetical protein
LTESQKIKKRTILMYGRSRAGKTAQIAEMAEFVMKTLGLKSLVYSIDKGGFGPLMPYVELGVIDLVTQDDTDPFIFLNKAAKGHIRDGKGWVPANMAQYGMVAHESMTGYGDALMNALTEKASQGVNVGGGGNVNLTIQDGSETLKIGGSNMAMYGIIQNRVLDEVWRSQKTSVPFVVWTASASRDEDQTAGGKVIGPAVIGKALTAELPRHFDLTFRLDCLPAGQGKTERHILYLGNSVDVAAGNAVGLGNTRIPMNVPKEFELPTQLEPASLVKALGLIEKAENAAKEELRKRLSDGR